MELVKKSNDLIQAQYALSLNEQRLILYLIGKITKSDTDFQDYAFTFADLAELTEIHKSRIYAEMKNIAYSLLRNPITFKVKNKELICNWCSSFLFDPDSKECVIKFDPNLKPFLLQLKKYFTSYNLKYVSGFRSKHSFRIYELCKQYESIKSREFSIAELKNILNLGSKYKQIGQLKDRVINSALQDINTYSDLNVSVKYRKSRRTITHLTLHISSRLENCKNEKQEQDILDATKQEQISLHAKQEQQNKNQEWFKKWKALLPEEQALWGRPGMGYGKFVTQKGIL
jgi:plasmid replication initiation protein